MYEVNYLLSVSLLPQLNVKNVAQRGLPTFIFCQKMGFQINMTDL